MEGELASGRNPDLVRLLDHMLGGPSPNPLATATDFAEQCGVMLWHYTSASDAAEIATDGHILASEGFALNPEGAYATTITPVQTEWNQTALKFHLFPPPTANKSVEAWVLMCKNQNPDFQQSSAPTDYWYIPAPELTPVPVVISGTGPSEFPPP